MTPLMPTPRGSLLPPPSSPQLRAAASMNDNYVCLGFGDRFRRMPRECTGRLGTELEDRASVRRCGSVMNCRSDCAAVSVMSSMMFCCGYSMMFCCGK